MQISRLKFIDQIAVDKIEADWYYFQEHISGSGESKEVLISFKVKDGYNYFLRKISFERPEYYTWRNSVVGIPNINIELLNPYRSRTHQNTRYNYDLVSPELGFSKNTFLQQIPIHGSVNLDLFYNQSELVQMRVSEIGNVSNAVDNGGIAVVFCGYHIPVNEGNGRSWFYGKN